MLSSYYQQKRKQQQYNAEKEIFVAVCDHTDSHEFERNDITSYFTKRYYDSNPKAPRHCHGSCGMEKLLGIDIPVNATNSVYVCKNCKNKNEPCNHAFCNGCYSTVQHAGNGKKRIRKQNDIDRLCK